MLAVVFRWYLSRGGEGSSTSLRSFVRAPMHAGGYFPVVPTARFRKMNGLTLFPRFDDAVPLFASQQQLLRQYCFANIKLRFRSHVFSHGFLIWTSAFPYCSVFHLRCASSSLCALRFLGCSKLLHTGREGYRLASVDILFRFVVVLFPECVVGFACVSSLCSVRTFLKLRVPESSFTPLFAVSLVPVV